MSRKTDQEKEKNLNSKLGVNEVSNLHPHKSELATKLLLHHWSGVAVTIKESKESHAYTHYVQPCLVQGYKSRTSTEDRNYYHRNVLRLTCKPKRHHEMSIH